MTPIAMVLLATMATTPAPAKAGTHGLRSQPVMVVAEPELDACGSLAEVSGTKPDGQAYLSLRSGPAVGYGEHARLKEGARLLVCEERHGWLGVLVVPPAGVAACDVSQPARKSEAYRGPCRSGWVSQRYVKGLAG